MAKLSARWPGLAGCALLTACFKLNPDFVDESPTGTSTAATDTGSPSSESTTVGSEDRVTEGLRVLYAFDPDTCETPGVVHPVVGDNDLVFVDPCAPCDAGGLHIEPGCDPLLESEGPEDLGPGTEFTLEAWVTMDADDGGANLMAQMGNFGVTTDAARSVTLWPDLTGAGPPLLQGAAPPADGLPSHLAITYDGEWIRILIDGDQVEQRQLALDAWSMSAPLHVGGSLSRPWRGTIHLLAVYDRALSYAEYCRNHAASPWPERGCP